MPERAVKHFFSDMSTIHSPRITRSQAPPRATISRESPEQASIVQAALEEIRQLHEERLQQQTQFETLLQQRDEQLRRLEERFSLRENQLIVSLHQNSLNNNRAVENSARNDLGYKLKPENYDGSVPLREFLTQFDLIARANGWNSGQKTVALAACFKRKSAYCS